MKLLAIDPARSMGWAAFIDGWLTRAGQGAVTDASMYIVTADIIVFEHPEIYRARLMKGDPNHLFKLVKQIGYIQGMATTDNFVEYLPKVWKGQVPKHIHHERAHSKLQTGDAIPPPFTQTDAWDAIALGMFHLKRIGRGGT